MQRNWPCLFRCQIFQCWTVTGEELRTYYLYHIYIYTVNEPVIMVLVVQYCLASICSEKVLRVKGLSIRVGKSHHKSAAFGRR